MQTNYDEIPFKNALFPIQIHQKSQVPPNYVQLVLTWHEQLEILYFSKGGAIVQIDNQKYVAKDNDIYIINPCELHSLNYYTDIPVFDCIMIDRQLYSSAEKDICEVKYLKPMENHQICFNNLIRDNSDLIRLINNIILENANASFAYELAIKAAILNILSFLFRNEINTIKSTNEIKRNILSYERLNPVFKYIEDNYTSEIKIETLANLSFLSVSHFSRFFKQVTGKSATHYINEYRISKAEILLKATDLSISDVAQRVGFVNNSYFAKCLKVYRDLTPSELRKRNVVS